MFGVPTSLLIKLAGGLAMVLFIAGLWVRGTHYMNQRDELKLWQDQVASATRTASHRPKLALNQVALQVTYMGQTIDTVRVAMEQVKAKAIADKLAADRKNEEDRRKADEAYSEQRVEDRQRIAEYIRTHSLRNTSGQSGSNHGGSDLPSPSFAPEVPNGPGANAIVVSALDFNVCTENSQRIKNAHDWAVKP